LQPSRAAASRDGGAALAEDDDDLDEAGDKPPSSKTEPSAVPAEEPAPARPVAVATIDAPPRKEDAAMAGPGEANAAGAGAETSDERQADVAAPADPTQPAEQSPVRRVPMRLVPAKPLAKRSKGPPTILLVIAAALVAAALTAFLLNR
jgi:hypothetical protein